MKNIFLPLLLLILPLITFAEKPVNDSCKQFLKGEFTVAGKPYMKITRNAKYQYEHNTQENIRSTYKIEWQDACSYTLTLIRTNDKSLIIKDQKGVPMPHKIIRSSQNRYTFTCKYSFMSRDQCGALRRHVKKEETLIKVD